MIDEAGSAYAPGDFGDNLVCFVGPTDFHKILRHPEACKDTGGRVALASSIESVGSFECSVDRASSTLDALIVVQSNRSINAPKKPSMLKLIRLVRHKNLFFAIIQFGRHPAHVFGDSAPADIFIDLWIFCEVTRSLQCGNCQRHSICVARIFVLTEKISRRHDR